MSAANATVLVVDDEAQIRKFLRISLTAKGYKVLEAANGRDGLAQAALGQPDLLVLDLGLPDMDGQEVLKELPFGIQEFLARVRVLLREGGSTETSNAAVITGSLNIDFAYRRITLAGEEISLTRKEFLVLSLLARHLDRVVTQQQLLKDIWGPSHAEDSHYLRVVIGHLRQKLGDNPAAPRFIVTEAGVGYRLIAR